MSEVIAALARHGQYAQPKGVPSAHLPHALTAEGRAAARAMADAVVATAAEHGWQVDSVIECSTLRRAWETAQVAAERLSEIAGSSSEIVQTDDLCERCVGAAANLTVEQIEEIVAADPRHVPLPEGWKSSAALRLPFTGAESLQQAGARVAAHLEASMGALQAQAQAPTLRLFVSHGAALRHACAGLGVLQPAQVPGLSMFHCRPVYVRREGLGRFAQVAGEFKVRPAAEARD